MKLYTQSVDGKGAKVLLDRMVEFNRPAADQTVKKYARDMVSDDWRLTGDTIKIDEDGNVFDGRHRLLAVILADKERPGISVDFAFAEGATRDAYTVTDIGRVRTAANAAYMLTNGRFSGQSMPIVRWHWQYAMGNPMGRAGQYSPNPTRAQEMDLFQSDPEGYEMAVKRGRDLQKQRVGNARVGGLFYYLVTRDRVILREQGEQFFDQLVSGANLEEWSPVLMLRNRLIQNRSVRDGHRFATYAPHELLYFYHRTWRAFCTDEVLGALILPRVPLNNQNFPKLYVPKGAE